MLIKLLYLILNGCFTDYMLADKPESKNGTSRSGRENLNRQCNSVLNLPTFVCNGEKVPLEVLELMSTNQNLYNVLIPKYPSLLAASRSFSDSGLLHENKHFVTSHIAPPSPLVIIPHPSIRHQSSLTHHDTMTDRELPKNTTIEEAYLWWLKNTQHHHQHHHSSRRSSASHIRDLKFHR
jgi:hypothetical protein